MPRASAKFATFALVPPVETERLSALRSEIVLAARAGMPRCIVDLDAVARLESPAISTLIGTLRDVREVGGRLSLVVTREGLLETLRTTGLDKVFEVIASIEPDGDVAFAGGLA